jgi:hypothetical protein
VTRSIMWHFHIPTPILLTGEPSEPNRRRHLLQTAGASDYCKKEGGMFSWWQADCQHCHATTLRENWLSPPDVLKKAKVCSAGKHPPPSGAIQLPLWTCTLQRNQTFCTEVTVMKRQWKNYTFWPRRQTSHISDLSTDVCFEFKSSGAFDTRQQKICHREKGTLVNSQ